MARGQLKSLIGTIRKKPTHAPDGRDDGELNGLANGEKTGILHDLRHMSLKDAHTMAHALPTLASGAPLDDKELLLEHGVSMLQGMPLNSGLSDTISKDFIKMLWHDLPHPVATLSGPEHKYRRHDGGGNNPFLPEMGKAGSPYARNVPPQKPKGPNLPDPELVFEQLLRRKGPFRKHPSGLNRLFFSFATIVYAKPMAFMRYANRWCFQTNRDNQWINETSSYVDLSTLYGNTEKQQKTVRTYENGRIFPDSIASERIMMMPPGVVAVLLMFSRNHNSIADSLLSVNEAGWYRPWEELDAEKQKKQDEDIFQLSRNINVGFFATVVLRDYVAAILNTPRANSTWSLDLGEEIKSGGARVERGTGNVVSSEFAVLYHWHAALSAADDKWMEGVIRHALPDHGSIDDLTIEDFKKVVMKQAMTLFSKPTKDWTFSGLERGPDGRFKDEDLADIIVGCIEEPAHAFGAHGTPNSLRIVDILGQLQARNVFQVCTMNEFRKYLNLQTYKSFEEWNPDPEVARAAELLYGHIDSLELYPGLMAECTKPPMPGSGVCPGQTTGRGILDDAVSLVRGDRFLTYDFNSSTLTNWGVSKLADVPLGSYGGMLPHLLFNSLPSAFSGTSSWALLPFYTPTAAKEILKGNKVSEMYDFERPAAEQRPIIGIHTQEGVKKAFEDRDAFRTMYQKAVRICTDGHEFLLGWDEEKRHNERSRILHSVFFENNFEANVKDFFTTNVRKLIKKSSLKYSGSKRSIDIVRDVTNVTPILWLAQKFAIPLKTLEQPHGLITVPQAFDAWLVLFIFQSFNIIPRNEWKLREGAMKAAPILRKIFETHLKMQQGFKESLVDWMAKGSAFEVGPEADRLYHKLNETKLPIGDLVGDCIGMGSPVAGNITQQASLLIDLFLSPEYAQYKNRIVELAHRADSDKAAFEELEGFVFEGMRHAGVVPGLPRVAAKDLTVNDGARGPIHIKAHQTVLLATSKANMDPAAFPNPEKLDPHRRRNAYTLLGHGMHFCFGARLVGCSLATTLKEVFKLKNVRRAPGKLGSFTTVEHELAGTKMRMYLDQSARESPIPTTLTLEYDE